MHKFLLATKVLYIVADTVRTGPPAPRMAIIVISGNGEIGSAVASALYRAGHRIVWQHEPGHVAVPEEPREVDGVLAKRARRLNDVVRMVGCGRAIAVAVEPLHGLVREARHEARVAPRPAVDASEETRDAR